MILVFDNRGLFTYNLGQCLGALGEDVEFCDSADHIQDARPSAVVLPGGSGVSEVMGRFAGEIPILAVGAGYQALVEVYGGRLIPAAPLHGKTAEVWHDSRGIFSGLKNPLTACHYHSQMVERELPECLEVTAWGSAGEVLGVRHRKYLIEGVQFHPEAFLTEGGRELLENFLALAKGLPLALQHREGELKRLIDKVASRTNLAEDEAEEAMTLIMDGEATSAQIAALITALRLKGETVEEITGFARAMRAKGRRIKGRHRLVDIVGTGGDRSFTFNISTTTAFVVAGAGLSVAKHGNRSVSSKCGSADLLEALGVDVTLSPEQVERCLEQTGICFLFAPVFHEAMKHAVTPRREIGIRTVFNLLGPLTNPAGAEVQLVGVYAPELTVVLAEVLQGLGVERAMVVHGDGLDEITHTGQTKVSELAGGEITTYYLTPEELGLRRGELSEICGGTAEKNAWITRAVLEGQPGPCRDVVLMNAAAALVAGERVETFVEGVQLAGEVIDSGAALKKLEELAAFK